MSKIRHDGKGVLTDHDGDPIKCGESVISEELWNLRVKKMVSQDIDNEKDDAKKLEKQEKKFKDLLKVKTDSRNKKKGGVKKK